MGNPRVHTVFTSLTPIELKRAIEEAEAIKRENLPRGVDELTPRLPYELQYSVDSETDPTKSYVVSKRKDSSPWECGCPQWVYHRKECKHIRKIKALVS